MLVAIAIDDAIYFGTIFIFINAALSISILAIRAMKKTT